MTDSRPAPRTQATVYADFTSPACYLASIRADRLAADGKPAPRWRAVEMRPRLPLTGIRLSGQAHTIRARELAATRVHQLPGEEFEVRVPGFLPNTRAAVAAYAEAYEVGIAARARHLLFAAYWVQGADIGDPEVLRRLLGAEITRARATTEPPVLSGYVTSSQRGPVSTAAYRHIRDWQRDWVALAAPADLTVVDPHQVVCETAALELFTTDRVLVA